jgi:SAM-dependent methyltransferase
MQKYTDPFGHLRNLEFNQTLRGVIGALAYPQAGMLVRFARFVLLIEHYWFWTRAHFRMGGLKAISERMRHRIKLSFASAEGKLDRGGSDAPPAGRLQENKPQRMHTAPSPSSRQELRWCLDEFIYFRGRVYAKGWAFCPEKPIVAVCCKLPSGRCCEADGYGLESRDVELAHGREARNCRFAFAVDVPENEMSGTITIVFLGPDGTRLEIKDPGRAINADPFHRAGARFWESLQGMTAGSVLEIGSRNRTGVVRKSLVPPSLQYTGFDIVPGQNVDVVGDAHFLSHYFPPNSFDVLFACSVFEHLLMPWKVVIELNRVMKSGGILMVTTHQTWPLHEEPWDFWRFSSHAWCGLFNRQTGFEVLESVMGEKASIVPHVLHPVVVGLDRQRCYLASLVVARKIGDTRLQWDVDPALLLDQEYPT